MKETKGHLTLVINNPHIKKLPRVHNEFMRLTTGLIHMAEHDHRISLTEREDNAVKVYFRERFVAVVKEGDKCIELIGRHYEDDINVTKAEAGIALLVDAMRKTAA